MCHSPTTDRTSVVLASFTRYSSSSGKKAFSRCFGFAAVPSVSPMARADRCLGVWATADPTLKTLTQIPPSVMYVWGRMGGIKAKSGSQQTRPARFQCDLVFTERTTGRGS